MTGVMIARPSESEYAAYYGAYIGAVPDGDLLDLLSHQGQETSRLLSGVSDDKSKHRYAPGKWSIRQVVGHIIDAERVFTYRALTFARGDAGPLPSFDEQAWADTSRADQRGMASLVAEFQAIRASSIALFQSFTEDELVRSGIASNNTFTVRALAYIVAGHERHHVRILRERYLSS